MPVLEYKCPNCGGGLELNPVNQKMKCPFCLSEFEQAEIERIFAEQEKALYQHLQMPELRRRDNGGRYHSGYFLSLLPQPGGSFGKMFWRSSSKQTCSVYDHQGTGNIKL